MPRPAKSVIVTAPPVSIEPMKAAVEKGTVKSIHLQDGFDLIGSKKTASNKEAEIFELDHGVLMVSKKTKRKIIIPFGNIKGYELL